MALNVQQNVLLAPYTTLQIGGAADYLCEVSSTKELVAACQLALLTGKPPLILGGGSNLLINDHGYRGWVLLMKNKGVSLQTDTSSKETLVRAAAGEDWDTLVEYTVEQGLCGLENLSGIPGTVGAAPVQNINAYGATVADKITSVEVYDYVNDKVLIFSKTECQFGYRDSIFKQAAGASLIVTAVTFSLAPADKANLAYRSASQSIEHYLKEIGITEPTPLQVRAAVLEAR
ncbi:MAG: FAD-binding protein, partial [Patescibacteria group bacterium]